MDRGGIVLSGGVAGMVEADVRRLFAVHAELQDV